ncbi:MAG: hypothetical protein ACI37Z_09490 [Candidatus Gastranaerophilaceae bacterium]
MYINKCTKCGAEFETKNPKRVICPNCLYPDRKQGGDSGENQGQNQNQGHSENTEETSEKRTYMNGYSAGGASFGGEERRYDRPQRSYGDRPQRSYDNGYNNYGDRPQRSYNSGYDRPQRTYDNRGYGDRPQRSYDNRGSYGDRPQRSYDNNRGGYGDRPQRNFNNRGNYGDRPQRNFRQQGNFRRNNNFNKRPQQKPKQLLISKEQLAQIEFIYKKALPLPNHDIHEVIGAALGIEPRKVFFGINLVRQKMMLPKLAFPKRKLAVTPDQLTAIKTLYEPLLPLPPIGCHKIIAAQLKMDEWRVHVGIGLIRKQMGLDRWNPDRADAPEEYKKK